MTDALLSVKEIILSIKIHSSIIVPTRLAIFEPEWETSIKRKPINFFLVPNQN
jgi:hypothetical protein